METEIVSTREESVLIGYECSECGALMPVGEVNAEIGD